MFLCYLITRIAAEHYLPFSIVSPSFDWPWSQALSGLLVSLLCLTLLRKYKPGFELADAGFTLKQKPGSLAPAIQALGLLLIFRIVFSVVFGGTDSSYDPEEVTFYALGHGTEKEPMYRGVLLYALSLALVSRPVNVFGANVNIAGLVTVALFALSHGVVVLNGELTLFYISLLTTAFYGLVLLWMRERTGSLLLPLFLFAFLIRNSPCIARI